MLLKAKKWICGTYQRKSSQPHKEPSNALCSLIFMLNPRGKEKSYLQHPLEKHPPPPSLPPIFLPIHVMQRGTTQTLCSLMPYVESSVNI